ncbi:MAG: hypothetical protein IJL06_10140, partial [Kiritimatiellae bacterium]|nr:hypothetical protein [Kiritimatiellia bacterium]
MTDPENSPDWAAEGGRASASRIRQDLDEMASSVREMEAFLQSASKPVSGGAAPAQPKGKHRGRPKGSKTNPEKLARQLALAEQTGAELLFTAAACIDAAGNPTGRRLDTAAAVD